MELMLSRAELEDLQLQAEAVDRRTTALAAEVKRLMAARHDQSRPREERRWGWEPGLTHSDEWKGVPDTLHRVKKYRTGYRLY